MPLVKHILERKGCEAWSVNPDVTVYEALRIMAQRNIGALLVVKDSELVGIFSERDYARKVVLDGRSSRKVAVSEIMTREVVTVGPEQSIEECMTLMTSERIRHLPVIDNGKLAGIVSIGDLVKEIISEQQFMIDQLENYIKGS